jgi:16S rRNA (guanine966-N2)-methyltransferase
MRIIAGEYRGRRLLSPPEEAETRPMPSRVRESLFGLFRGHVKGAQVFDVFAGTGCFGLEALSRGASKVVFVERDRAMAKVLAQNIATINGTEKSEIFEGDALGAGALARCPRPATLILLDPPYPMIRQELGWARVKAQAEALIKLLEDDGYLVLRTPHPFFLDVEAEVVEENLHNGRGNGKGKKSKPKREPRWSMRDLEREARAMRTGKGVKKLGGVRDVPIEDLRKRSEDLDLSSLSDEELDALDAADEEALANRGVKKDAAVSRVPAVLVSLELAGAIGPETHVYGTTAAHLYMKKKA